MAVPQRNNPAVRGFRPLFTFLLIAGILGAAAGWYAAPNPELDWDRGELPSIADKVLEMIAKRSLSVTVTEAELNALVKQELYKQRFISNDLEMTGAETMLDGDRMTVFTDLVYKGRVRFQLKHQFQFAWEAPELTATHLSTSLKDIPLPASWFPIGTIRVPLSFGEKVPAEVRQVQFLEDAVQLDIKLLLTNPFF